MLEETQLPYKITSLDLKKGDQFNPKFRSISPFSKIPVITDHENNISIFESGAILINLGEKSGKFYDVHLLELLGSDCLNYRIKKRNVGKNYIFKSDELFDK